MSLGKTVSGFPNQLENCDPLLVSSETALMASDELEGLLGELGSLQSSLSELLTLYVTISGHDPALVANAIALRAGRQI